MFRRTTATLVAAAAIALAVAAPARASAPALESYAAAATATALQLTLLGEEAAVSQTQAAVNSEPKAAADGAALLIAGTAIPSGAPAATPGGSPTNEACPGNVDLEELSGGALSGLTASIACVDTSATVTDSAPDAWSESGEVIIRLKGLGGDVLAPVLEAVLDPLVTAVDEQTDPLCEALAPLGLCELVDSTVQIDLQGLIDEILADLAELDNGAFTVAEIAVAPTRSAARASAEEGVVAEAGSTGVSIKLFPGIETTIAGLTGLIEVPNDSLLTLQVGNATAKVVRDPNTGAADADPGASAAQLLSASLTDNLGILSTLVGEDVPALLDSLAEAGAALSCDGGALADLACIDLGAVKTLSQAELEARNMWFGEGTVGREASAASIAVLPVLADVIGGDVLALSLATSTAAANATPAAPLPRTPTDDTPRSLPRTGGAPALPLTLALLGIGAAGMALVRRTRTV